MRTSQLFGRHAIHILVVFVVMAFSLSGSAQAQGSPAISQGFEAKDDLPVGGLVSLVEEGTKSSVELADSDHVSDLAGVVADNSLLEISKKDNKVQIVTTGVTLALVSNINGEVKNGDKITASPVAGVGMKAFGGTQIVGIAQADLTAVETVNRDIKDRFGQAETIKIGKVPLQVNVSYYAEQEKQSILPPFLEQFAYSIAGKEVPVVRIVLALLILFLGFISVGVMLYASVRSSIISIGRNPLSEVAVRKSLFSVASVGLAILLVMLSTIYLILTV